MSTGNIRKTFKTRNYARPTKPATASATTIADSLSLTVSYTAPSVGPTPTSYLVTGTSNTGASVSSAITTSPTTVAGFSSGATYNVTVAGQNYNGPGETFAAATGLVIPTVYALQSTYNASGTYTVGTGITKIAGYVIGSGGGGASGTGRNNGSWNVSGGGGGAGGSGAIVGFKDYTVTAGQTVTITVGAKGNQGTGVAVNTVGSVGNAGGVSKIIYAATDIVTANGGSGGAAGALGAGANGPNNGGAGGAGGTGGTGSSNVSGAVLVTGVTGGAGGGVATAGSDGGLQNSTSNITGAGSVNITAINPSNTTSGSGGGGGTGNNVSFSGYGNGGLAAGGSGAGGASESAASSATGAGAGGGGGGGTNYNGTTSGAGGAGFDGRVILYVA